MKNFPLLMVIIGSCFSIPLVPQEDAHDCKSNHFNWNLFKTLTLKCWNSGKALKISSYSCTELNGQCDEDGRFFYDPNSRCAHLRCKVYTDMDGTVCKFPEVSYNGLCTDPFDKSICGSLGRRLMPNIFGEYSCQCVRTLGFLEYQGSCYPEYLKGPCGEKEQLILTSSGPECKRNNCQNLEVEWKDGSCVELQHVENFKLFTMDEIKVLDPYNITALSVFSNCRVKAKETGECLKSMSLPAVTLETNFSQYFPENFNSITL